MLKNSGGDSIIDEDINRDLDNIESSFGISEILSKPLQNDKYHFPNLML